MPMRMMKTRLDMSGLAGRRLHLAWKGDDLGLPFSEVNTEPFRVELLENTTENGTRSTSVIVVSYRGAQISNLDLLCGMRNPVLELRQNLSQPVKDHLMRIFQRINERASLVNSLLSAQKRETESDANEKKKAQKKTAFSTREISCAIRNLPETYQMSLISSRFSGPGFQSIGRMINGACVYELSKKQAVLVEEAVKKTETDGVSADDAAAHVVNRSIGAPKPSALIVENAMFRRGFNPEDIVIDQRLTLRGGHSITLFCDEMPIFEFSPLNRTHKRNQGLVKTKDESDVINMIMTEIALRMNPDLTRQDISSPVDDVDETVRMLDPGYDA